MSTLQFLGATGTVTGSKYLLEHDGFRMLVDCGLFQGLKELRLRNWSPPPFDPGSLGLVLLTHAHLDHSGYLPVLYRNGYAGEILAWLEAAATRPGRVHLVHGEPDAREALAASIRERMGLDVHCPGYLDTVEI